YHRVLVALRQGVPAPALSIQSTSHIHTGHHVRSSGATLRPHAHPHAVVEIQARLVRQGLDEGGGGRGHAQGDVRVDQAGAGLHRGGRQGQGGTGDGGGGAHT